MCCIFSRHSSAQGGSQPARGYRRCHWDLITLCARPSCDILTPPIYISILHRCARSSWLLAVLLALHPSLRPGRILVSPDAALHSVQVYTALFVVGWGATSGPSCTPFARFALQAVQQSNGSSWLICVIQTSVAVHVDTHRVAFISHCLQRWHR